MNKWRIIDALAVALPLAGWAFFAFYEQPSRFDLTPKLTLPLLLALEATAISAIYFVWRVNSRKGGTTANVRELVARMYSETEPTDEQKDRRK